MTIHHLRKPCFILDPSPRDEDAGTPHYSTWAEADEDLRERREELGPDPKDLASIEKTRVKQLGSPCWVAECDAPHGMEGTCGNTLGDEEEGPSCIHFETVEELFDWMPGEGWIRVFEDNALCWVHSPDNPAPPPPSPAELEAAGQLVLPGVLA
jgi:hypothetical protein